jgi:hypothetical protein
MLKACPVLDTGKLTHEPEVMPSDARANRPAPR